MKAIRTKGWLLGITAPLILGFFWERQASADEIPCMLVESSAIQINGLLGDWGGVEGVGADRAANITLGADNWSGPEDLSFNVYCNHDDKNLYLAINVKDEYFIRSRRLAGDDHLVVKLGRRQLVIYPGDLRNIPGRMTWGKRGRVKGIEMAEALQEGGYSVELRIPFKSVSGLSAGIPAMSGYVSVADTDSKAKQKTQTIMSTAGRGHAGRLVFAQAQANQDAFLRDRGYNADEIRTKIITNVVGDSRPEQVLLVGRTIGILGDGLPDGAYYFLDLPVQRAKDVYWLKQRDLNGDGLSELITRYVERSANGRRELIAVFRFNSSDAFVRSFAHEIFKGQGNRTISNRFTFARRRGRRRGVDLIFDRPKARGFSAQTYQEAPSSDCVSILLPWNKPARHRFRFEGEEYFQY